MKTHVEVCGEQDPTAASVTCHRLPHSDPLHRGFSGSRDPIYSTSPVRRGELWWTSAGARPTPPPNVPRRRVTISEHAGWNPIAYAVATILSLAAVALAVTAAVVR